MNRELSRAFAAWAGVPDIRFRDYVAKPDTALMID